MEYMSESLISMIRAARRETCKFNGWHDIDPLFAEALISLNVQNYRVKNPSNVVKYAKDMAGGFWEVNGEPIVVSNDGILRNGQHRLHAIVMSGKTVRMYVIYDADPSTIYDLQSKRTCVQILRAQGYSVTPVIPSIARTVICGHACRTSTGDAKVIDYVINHYETLKKTDSIISERSTKGKVGRKGSCGTIVYCVLRTGEMPETELRDFFKVLNSGYKRATNKDASSVLALRKQLMALGDNTRETRDRIMEYTYLALKDFHAGIHVEKDFVYPDNGKTAERLIKEVMCDDNHCLFDPAA